MISEPNITSSRMSRYVIANGIEMHVLEVGNGPALVLIHGAMGTALDNFSDVIAELSSNFKVIAPDSRGHGKTKDLPMELNYSLMADDIAELITEMKLDQPFLLGWSDGGQISLDLAIRYPDLLRAIAVGGAYIRMSDQHREEAKLVGLHGPGEVDFDILIETFPQTVAHWRDIHSDQGEDQWKKLFLALSYVAMNPLPYSETDLKRITAPTLIFLGDRDQFVPIEQPVEMYRRIPNAELAVYPDTDHSLRRNGSLIARIANDFFAKQLVED